MSEPVMRWISALSASEVSGPVARMVHCVPSVGRSRRRDFFADHANGGLGGDGLGDAARKLDAIDGERVARRNGRFIRNAQESGTRAAHLLLQQPGRGVGRLALERVGADQLAEFGGLVGGGQARLAVDDGAHLVEVDLAAEARRGQRGFRAGKSAADDANSHVGASSADRRRSWLLCLRLADSSERPGDSSQACSASPVTRTLRHASRNSAPMAR